MSENKELLVEIRDLIRRLDRKVEALARDVKVVEQLVRSTRLRVRGQRTAERNQE
jgi:hypothetical protein